MSKKEALPKDWREGRRLRAWQLYQRRRRSRRRSLDQAPVGVHPQSGAYSHGWAAAAAILPTVHQRYTRHPKTCSPFMVFATSQSLQYSSKVASGCASSCGRNLSCSIPVFLGGHPGIVFGAMLPVSRRSLRYRLIDASDTPKSLITSLLDIPWSTAVTTRSRKSSEYAFI